MRGQAAERVYRRDGDQVRGGALQGVQDGAGAAGVHREEARPQAVRGEELLPGQEDNPPQETLPRVPQRDQAELRHALGDGRERGAGGAICDIEKYIDI